MSQNTSNPLPLIGVSRCLLGIPVRYDGQSKPCPEVINLVSSQVSIHSFCPEVDIGLGVPREPVKVTLIDQQKRVIGVNNPLNDISDQLCRYADEIALLQLNGMICKSRSPSCGISSTPISSDTGEMIGSGLFSDRFQKQSPQVPMIEEHQLASPQELEHFLHLVYQHFHQQQR